MKNKANSNRVLFQEEQWVRKSPMIWLFYFAFLVSVGPISFGTYEQLVLGKPWERRTMPDDVLIGTFLLVLLIMVGLTILFSYMCLQVQVTNSGLTFRFPPFILRERQILKADLERFELRKYRPIFEYGGWGIRVRGQRRGRGKKFGIAYNVKGNIGLQLYLKNGDKVLIGTQNPVGMEKAMKKLMESEGI